MANPSKARGTKGETDLVNWFHDNGEPQVERHALHGNKDIGDINGVPSLTVSVKAYGPGQKLDLSVWLNELDVMRVNAKPMATMSLPAGLLVVRRTRYPNPGDWYAVQTVSQWWDLYKELLT